MNDPEPTGAGCAEDVLALVLTHSSPSTLAGCIRALQSQSRPPDHILVIDNAGTPPATATLAGIEGLEVIRRDRNTGPAGGHAFGLGEFAARRAAWAWVMDDDVLPEPDCLERLLDAASGVRRPRVVWPRIRELSGRAHDYPGWCGVLLAREVVDTVGVPMAELVWWAEDTEYLQRRITRAGFEPDTADAAVVIHASARDEAAMPPWKVYYQVRNTIYYRVHVQGLNHPLRLARSLIRSFGAAILPPGPRALRVRRYVEGTIDGARGRLGPRVELPS